MLIENFVEVEDSLLGLAFDLSGRYEYWVEFEETRVWKPIILWLYCKNRETFIEKFRKQINLKKDPHNLAENFIRIYLEHKDEVYVIHDGVTLYPSCFANRYLREITDNSYGFNDETGVYGADFYYP